MLKHKLDHMQSETWCPLPLWYVKSRGEAKQNYLGWATWIYWQVRISLSFFPSFIRKNMDLPTDIFNLPTDINNLLNVGGCGTLCTTLWQRPWSGAQCPGGKSRKLPVGFFRFDLLLAWLGQFMSPHLKCVGTHSISTINSHTGP